MSLYKGGVGKTTTAVNLAHALALRGRSVVLVDTDTQGQAGRALGVAAERGLAEMIADGALAADVMVPSRDGLALISGGPALAGAKRAIDRKDFAGEQTVAEALRSLNGACDYVVVDTAPGYDALTINVLFYADEILAPVSLEVLSLQGLAEFSRSLDAVRQYKEALALRYVVPTFYDRRVRKSHEILQQVRACYGDAVCRAIRYSVRLSEAPGFGQTIFEYAPGSAGAEDYAALAERVDNDGPT